MLENMIVALLLFSALLACDFRTIAQLGWKSRSLYLLCTLSSIYLALIFIFHLSWFHYGDLLKAIYGWPAGQVVGYLKHES
ncbi:hypothetical protein [Paenibacillus agricola]|uniref:Uncharacterized protein n=1 Tax=Paenibacillus agricola TaxID=2716264 RepID=A0ABX0J7L7_9BACL|nr:hypothetical protein [Paenibacillus agricola]NHN30838.1 hypothetical protein [Paenibacillus agricola]